MTISSNLNDPRQLLNPFGTSPCKIGDMILDVVVVESPEFSWTATQYKTQSGYTASDVRIKNPDRLTLECVFVDKHYGAKDLISAGLTGSGFAPETWRDKYKNLKELVDSDDIVTVTIGLDVFPGMAVVGVGIVRDEQRAGYLAFTLTLEEVRVVDVDFDEVDTSLMPPLDDDGEDDATKKRESKKRAKKPDKKKSEPKKSDEPKRQSLLYGMTYG